MKKHAFFISCAAMVYCVSHNSFAADSEAAQIQLLNSQIQSQIQSLQEVQQKQVQDLNTKIQAQMQQMQKELDDKIQLANKSNQEKMKQIKEGLEAQIKQVDARIK